MRKTVTSCEVKDRWNRNHYDQVLIRTAKGGREAIRVLAAAKGKSVSEYIRGLIIADAARDERFKNADISAFLGGGGVTNINALRAAAAPPLLHYLIGD